MSLLLALALAAFALSAPAVFALAIHRATVRTAGLVYRPPRVVVLETLDEPAPLYSALGPQGSQRPASGRLLDLLREEVPDAG